MAEVGIDIADRTPKYVADLDPAQYGVESHEWDLTNPDGQDMETVRDVRDETERRVKSLFDELDRRIEQEQASPDSSGGVITAIRDALSL